MLSRFITTAMLPKLAAINKERKIVFLLATNFISGFDAAFRRGGRFDMLLQVMPPNLAAKLSADPEKFPEWAATLVALHSDFDRLKPAQSSSGRSCGSTSSSMLRAVLGCLLMKPCRSSISTIW